MDEPKIAQTWEECAAHVEAGGVVETKEPLYGWVEDRRIAAGYRVAPGAPGDGRSWPRRLLPIVPAEQPEPEHHWSDSIKWSPDAPLLTPTQAATLASPRDEVNRRGPDEVLSELREAACSAMGREDVLSRLHPRTRGVLGDLIVDLAMLLDAPKAVQS